MISKAVARYGARFHRLLGGTHSVASPFGAWLLLALVAPAATGEIRKALEEVLGCEPDEAFKAAARLLDDPHAEIVLGAAVWHDPRFETEALLDFLRRLAARVERGPVPTQAEVDAWARERTLGLIERFPLDVEGADPLVVLLATAIATKVSWQVPFTVVGAAEALLPTDAGFADTPLLRDPGSAAFRGFVRSDAGLLALHCARSTDGLLVASGIAAETADPAAVLDATAHIARSVAADRPPRAVSLFDLDLGDGPAWRITEATESYTGAPERYEILVPAWEMSSDHDLTGADLGFAEAGAALIELLPRPTPPMRYDIEARQSAMARYTRVGFEAAAVTALGIRLTSAAPQFEQGPVRTARIEFTRPHAVVAATSGDGDWNGLPVFSGWVAAAVPAE